MKTIVLDGDSAVSRLIDWLLRGWQEAAKVKRPLVVMVAHAEEPCTTRQRRQYWRLLRYVAEHAHVDGRKFDAEYWEEFFKRRFIGTEELDGEVVGIGTSDLSIAEFNELMREIEAYASTHLGLEIHL